MSRVHPLRQILSGNRQVLAGFLALVAALVVAAVAIVETADRSPTIEGPSAPKGAS